MPNQGNRRRSGSTLQIVESEAGLALVGEADLAQSARLEAALVARVASGGTVVLDLSDLTFMDSSGLHAIIAAARALGERGRLVLLKPATNVSRIFEITGIGRLPNVQIDFQA